MPGIHDFGTGFRPFSAEALALYGKPGELIYILAKPLGTACGNHQTTQALVRNHEQKLMDIECPHGFAIVLKQHRGYLDQGLIRCHEVFAYHLGLKCAYWFPLSYLHRV